MITVALTTTEHSQALSGSQELIEKLEAMFEASSTKEIWVGNLTQRREKSSRSCPQGRATTRRCLVSSLEELNDELVALLQEEEWDNDPYTCWNTGVLIRPFWDSQDPDPTIEDIVLDIDSDTEGAYVIYHPTLDDKHRGLDSYGG